MRRAAAGRIATIDGAGADAGHDPGAEFGGILLHRAADPVQSRGLAPPLVGAPLPGRVARWPSPKAGGRSRSGDAEATGWLRRAGVGRRGAGWREAGDWVKQRIGTQAACRSFYWF
jgi:hypothetical protein